mmetsp:Transcript_8487/g.17441  ORF Transcript_8487/g.17441 Transcript_8487/m.17441 type:complete len:399 (-) Transcript_8487:706-1902(-)
MQHSMRILALHNQHEEGGAHERNPCRVKVVDGMQQKADDDAQDDVHAAPEEREVLDLVLVDNGDDVIEPFHLALQVLFEDEHQRQQAKGDGKQHARRQVLDEVDEANVIAQLIADDDVGRVTNHRHGATDVGQHRLRHEQRHWVAVHRLEDRHRHRHHEQHRRHIIKPRRQERGDECDVERQVEQVAFAAAQACTTQHLKHASTLQLANDDHHAKQQAKRAKVEPCHDGRQVGRHIGDEQHAQHGKRAAERDPHPVEHLKRNAQQHQADNRQCDPLLVQPKRTHLHCLDVHRHRHVRICRVDDTHNHVARLCWVRARHFLPLKHTLSTGIRFERARLDVRDRGVCLGAGGTREVLANKALQHRQVSNGHVDLLGEQGTSTRVNLGRRVAHHELTQPFV